MGVMHKLTKSDYFPVFVACLSLFALGWMDNARGPFFPLFLEATGESSSKGALFFAVASFVAILSSAVAGLVLEKFGLKKLLLFGGLAMGLSPLGLAYLPTLQGALVTAFLFGTGLGWVAVGQNILISLVKKVELRRQLFALLHCFYALAAMTAPLTILKLKSVLPWNWLLIGVLVLTVPFVFSLMFLTEEKQEVHVEKIKPPPLSDFWVLIWVLFLSFYISSELILSTRLVVFTQGFGLSFTEASQHLFLFFLSMFMIRLLFFFVKLPVSALKILLVCLLSALVFLFLGYNVSTYFFALVGASMGPVFPVVMDEMSHMWPERFDVLVARVIALSSMFVVTAHMGVGRLTDVYGIEKAMYAVPVLICMALVILMTGMVKKSKR
ncbi:MAG: MFS transporter [Bdellovibrionales bacterium]